jgi:DNA (cytosine-5)-methyltransferase 1
LQSVKPVKALNMKPKAIDLFSGCGGLTVGLQQAGFEVVAAVEIDPKARQVYTTNHPRIWMAGHDIRRTSASEIIEKLDLKPGELDLLAGCPPCQGFSRLRRRNKSQSVRDERNALIDDFGRFVQAIRPRSILLENVVGLSRYHKFADFISLLRSLDYIVEVKQHDSALFNVSQRRVRLIVMASQLSLGPELKAKRGPKKTVRNAIGALPQPGSSGDPLHDIPTRHSARVAKIISAVPEDGGSRHHIPVSLQLKCHGHSSGFNDVYGRMKWDDVAPTITSGCINPSKGRFIHPSQNRAITLREAAILQGFPRRYRFDPKLGKEALAAMIGNALPPPFIKAQARRLRLGLEAGE